jgi:hypothetical protein
MNRDKQYEKNSDFLEFLNNEFDKTAVNATVEELAEFAFGGLSQAIKAFEKRINNENRSAYKSRN